MNVRPQDMGREPARVLYVVPRFPAASETFVAEEVLGVAARGRLAGVVALARPMPAQQARFGSRLEEAAALASYLPRMPAREALPALRLLGSEAFRQAGETGALLTLLRAMAVAGHARRTGANFIYAHWPRPSQVACLAAGMAGLPFGISVHAHEVAHDSAHFPIVLPRAALAAFCNAAAMHLLARLCPAAAERFHLVYHGVDLGAFEARPMPPFDGLLRIATAGRLTPTKGFDRLILAVARLSARGVPVHLNIIGEGGDRASLEALARSLGVCGQVTFKGWVSHERMPALLADAHLFALLPDVNFHDGLPNVVLEAMALGRPVLLSALPAAAEAVDHGVEGFVVGLKDFASALADICASLVADPARLAPLGKAARARICREHDRLLHLDRLVDLFDRSAAIVPTGAN
jgi:glycosyltransferase involved in cell wall biosynthesis